MCTQAEAPAVIEEEEFEGDSRCHEVLPKFPAPYEALAILGEGKFGAVYKCLDRSCQRLVAMKLAKADEFSKLVGTLLRGLTHFNMAIMLTLQVHGLHVCQSLLSPTYLSPADTCTCKVTSRPSLEPLVTCLTPWQAADSFWAQFPSSIRLHVPTNNPYWLCTCCAALNRS